MIIVNDLKPGTAFEYEGNIYQTLSTILNKTAMRQMVVKVHVKDLRSGTIKDVTFTGGDKVEEADIEKREMQYLYDEGEALVFMDTDTYDQIEIEKSRLKWELNFLRPQGNIWVIQYKGEILGIILPDKVELEVIEAEEAVKGDTATAALKNAVLETGWQIKVPLFIKQGEMLIISTADGKYCGRA
ncbi:MAG: elongation factor P [Erysipelotrichaceae bacterium]|nr:elongation factor P [Erysipelotrichaceae bacterium]